MQTPLLLPIPREISLTGGTLDLTNLNGFIGLKQDPAAPLLFVGQRAQTALRQFAGIEWSIAGGDLPASLMISVDAKAGKAEGYRLSVGAQGVQIIGSSPAGAFYGVCTLVQLLQIHGATLPLLELADYPEFPARGVMLDISRDKVPTMDTLYALIDMLAGWKINQVQLYTEHTFAYRNHRTVWQNASPMTAEEILNLDAFCRERFIELVPNQNSIGHMHRWFMHQEYLHLAETEVGLTTPWGTKQDYPFSLSPAVPETLVFLEELYDELLPNFTSRKFNVGGDEAFDLGEGRSKALAQAKGKGRLYLDYLLEIYQRVKARGRTMQFWGDIINQHPDLVPLLPKDTIALEWGYEADHDYPGKSALFAASGIPFYVCPGTSSWTTIAGRTDNTLGNIRNAVENGLKNGAIGVLNTDWGDLGHWQPLPISYLGFAYGAALSWGYQQNVGIDLPAVLSAFAFRDSTGVMGRVAYDLGNAYQQPGITVRNGSFLFWAYLRPLNALRDTSNAWIYPQSHEVVRDAALLTQKLHETIDYIDEIVTPVEHAKMAVPDADLIKHEFAAAAHMLKHGAKRALSQLDDKGDNQTLLADLGAIEVEFRQNWLARNRIGGLDDSVARLRKTGKLYSE
jgi:hypothetical protein